MRFTIIPLLLVIACASTGGERSNEKKSPSADIQAAYIEAVNRLTPLFVQNGWIVSRYEDGAPEHQGDSLIWTGLAMAALPCSIGDQFENRMIEMINDNDGALVRFEPLGEYANGREVTLDGATGLYYGVFQRLRNCKSHEKWKAVWKKHVEYLEANDWVLHPNVTSTVIPEFNSIRDYISHELGLGEPVDGYRYRTLEAMALGWTTATIESRSPCFRVHLSWLYLSFLEDSGNLLHSAHWGFCNATVEANVPLYDHWCGRRDIDKWVAEFVYDQWEMRNQRCHAPDWETPDGRPNLMTPAIDLLFNISFAYPEVLND